MPVDEDERDRRLERIRSHIANIPQNVALGISPVEVRPAEALLQLPYDEKLVGNPDTGVIHGGVITTLLDVTSGTAVYAALDELVPIATLDLRIDYLRAADPGKTVLARATCYKKTRNVAFTRAVAYHADDPSDPIAHAVGTFMQSTKRGGIKP